MQNLLYFDTMKIESTFFLHCSARFCTVLEVISARVRLFSEQVAQRLTLLSPQRCAQLYSTYYSSVLPPLHALRYIVAVRALEAA